MWGNWRSPGDLAALRLWINTSSGISLRLPGRDAAHLADQRWLNLRERAVTQQVRYLAVTHPFPMHVLPPYLELVQGMIMDAG